MIDLPLLVKAREPRISDKFWFWGTLRESTRYPGITTLKETENAHSIGTYDRYSRLARDRH